MIAHVRWSTRIGWLARASAPWLPLALLVAAGCDDARGDDAELPAGWERATKIVDFTQRDCDQTNQEGEESIAVDGVAAGIELAYRHAHFRCSQDVEGFVRRGEGQLDILIQPVDMNPRSVAKCDCRYEISANVSAAAGEHAVTVYRRWDNINSDNDPVKVGSTEVVVPDRE